MDPKNTSFPIMFVTAEIDPVLPERGYDSDFSLKVSILNFL